MVGGLGSSFRGFFGGLSYGGFFGRAGRLFLKFFISFFLYRVYNLVCEFLI